MRHAFCVMHFAAKIFCFAAAFSRASTLPQTQNANNFLRFIYHKIQCIRHPFDAQNFFLMPKLGGGLIHEDLTFYIKVKSRNEQVFQSIIKEWNEFKEH